MKRLPVRSIVRRRAARALACAAHAAVAVAPLLGLALATPAALAQRANPWMDPTLVVLVSRFDLNSTDLRTLGAVQKDRLFPRPIYLLSAIDGNGPALVLRLAAAVRNGGVPGGPAVPVPVAIHVGTNRQVRSPVAGGLFDQFGSIRARGTVSLIGEQEIGNSRVPKYWTDPWLSAPALHAESRGTGITVAVLDTGIDLQHPSFAGRLRQGRDFVSDDLVPAEVPGPGYGHGTHVAGVIARTSPSAKIMPVRVIDANGYGSLWTVAKGAVFAVDPDGIGASRDGARVLNMSFGAALSPVPEGLEAGDNGMLQTTIKLVSCHAELFAVPGPFSHAGYGQDRTRCSDPAQRSVVVAGQGNDARARPLLPAAYSSSMPAVLAVTASDHRGFRAVWATKGAANEIVAPGQWITSDYPMPAGVAIMSGMSMATPWVSGVAALLMSKYGPTLPTPQVRNIIRGTGATVCESQGSELAPPRALKNDTSLSTACR